MLAVAWGMPEGEGTLQKDPSPWTSKPYGRPRGDVRALRVNGVVAAQAIVGAEAGLRYVHQRDGKRDLLGRTRILADALVGLGTDSFGYQARLGSFIGPTSEYVTWQVGPDLWVSQYGSPTSIDYHLPWSPGIDIPNVVLFHVHPAADLQLGASPGWAFRRPRQVNRIGPFHELSGFAAVAVSAGGFSLVVGLQRVWNAAGATDGLILSGGF